MESCGGQNPARQRLVTGRKQVLRGRGATPAAKRRPRVCGPRDSLPKAPTVEADAVRLAEGSIVTLYDLGMATLPGAQSGARTQGLPRNLGDLLDSDCTPRRMATGRTMAR